MRPSLTRTSICPGVATCVPSPAALAGHLPDKAVRGALAVIHLTGQRSTHARIRGSRTRLCRGQHPQAIEAAGAMSHAGTAGLPKPRSCLPGLSEEGKGGEDGPELRRAERRQESGTSAAGSAWRLDHLLSAVIMVTCARYA